MHLKAIACQQWVWIETILLKKKGKKIQTQNIAVILKNSLHQKYDS